MIFQAMGAKYTFSSATRYLFAGGNESDGDKLCQALKNHYSGEVTLYHKGRAALAEAIRLATGGRGNVAISGLTCYSVVQAVKAAGCTPIFIDINEDDLQFSADELRKHKDIKAVVIQNMLGLPADIVSIERATREMNAVLIEDLAHSAGASYSDGREVGTVGDITMLSFGKDKAIDVVNGGALIIRGDYKAKQPTRAPKHQMKDRLYPSIAWWTRVFYPIGLGKYIMALAIKLSLVSRSADGEVDTAEMLPHWQAKLALRQIENLSNIAKERHQKSKIYIENLQKTVPKAVKQAGSAPARLPLLVDNRDEVIAVLHGNGIQANDIWYDMPVSPIRFYKKANYSEKDCPVAVNVASRLINLPTHEQITSENIIKITEIVNRVAQQ